MAYGTYHKAVKAVVGSSEYEIPVGNMRLGNDPVSRNGVLAQPLFNSRVIQTIDGWHVRLSIEHPHLEGGADDVIRRFIESLLDAGVCTIDFDPDGEFETSRTIDFVLDEATNAVVADFIGRGRTRPSSLSLVSRRLFPTPIDWITS